MKTFIRVEPTTVYEVGDRYKREVVVKRYRTEDGLEHEFTTWHKENTHSVAVLGLTLDNQVIITRQFRSGREQICDDLPGGAVEAGEDFEIAARRELSEETGYRPGDMTYLGTYSWDAYTNMKSHYFFATNCIQEENSLLHDRTEDEQGIETVLISIDELIENACSDRTTDVAAVLMAYDTLKKIKGEK